MSAKQVCITCVVRNSDGDIIGFGYTIGGSSERHTMQPTESGNLNVMAVRLLLETSNCFTEVEGGQAPVYLRKRAGHAYLTTDPDGHSPNNLNSLPRCHC